MRACGDGRKISDQTVLWRKQIAKFQGWQLYERSPVDTHAQILVLVQVLKCLNARLCTTVCTHLAEEVACMRGEEGVKVKLVDHINERSKKVPVAALVEGRHHSLQRWCFTDHLQDLGRVDHLLTRGLAVQRNGRADNLSSIKRLAEGCPQCVIASVFYCSKFHP